MTSLESVAVGELAKDWVAFVTQSRASAEADANSNHGMFGLWSGRAGTWLFLSESCRKPLFLGGKGDGGNRQQ